MSRARKVDHKAVEQYAQQHPEAIQTDIGRVFGITQGSVGRILRRASLTNTHRGVPRKATKPPKGTWAECAYFYWDKYLERLGFGVSRGEKLGRQRILYGYDPLQQALQDESATLLEEDESEGVIEPLYEQCSIERYLPATAPASTDDGDTCL
jgi:hypothetical protein